jgi:YVTN family beta-propeller protein
MGGTMKVRISLTALCCALSAVSAQWLVNTIQLPDSSEPNGLFYCAANNKLYAANVGNNSVSIIDCTGNGELITTLPLGEYAQPMAFCYNALFNKIYCSADSIDVIDGLTNQLLGKTSMYGEENSTPLICYNHQNNTLYCATNYWSDLVFLIDGATDTVVGYIIVGSCPSAIYYNELNWRVYCACYYSDSVYVIDHLNRVVWRIPVGHEPTLLFGNPDRSRLYCIDNSYSTISVIDCDNSQVIATMNDSLGFVGDLCCNTQNNKVYCCDHANTVNVIDGDSNRVIARVEVGNYAWALCYNPASNKVFCANGDTNGTVSVIDGTTNEVVATVDVGQLPSAIADVPNENRIYVANYGSSTISVLCGSGGVEEENRRPPIACPPAPFASVVRGVLRLPPAPGSRHQSSSSLLGISGQKVMELEPGENDVSRLPAGVYFVAERPQASGLTPHAVLKVVLTR